MPKLPYIIFSIEYIINLYGGSYIIENNILYFGNDKDEFYCDLQNKTDKNKYRFWHRYKGQEDYHRQIDRKNIVAGLYQCLTHKNRYENIPYCRQNRMLIQKIISEKWQQYKKVEGK